MTTPWTLLGILAAYLYFVNDIGTKWMKKREAFELKTTINLYNLFQIAANAYMVVTVSLYWEILGKFSTAFNFKIFIYAPRLKDYKLFCVPNPRGDESVAALKIYMVHYFYLLIKIVDLLDTVRMKTMASL